MTGPDVQCTLCACVPYIQRPRNNSGAIVAADVQRLDADSRGSVSWPSVKVTSYQSHSVLACHSVHDIQCQESSGSKREGRAHREGSQQNRSSIRIRRETHEKEEPPSDP